MIKRNTILFSITIKLFFFILFFHTFLPYHPFIPSSTPHDSHSPIHPTLPFYVEGAMTEWAYCSDSSTTPGSYSDGSIGLPQYIIPNAISTSTGGIVSTSTTIPSLNSQSWTFNIWIRMGQTAVQQCMFTYGLPSADITTSNNNTWLGFCLSSTNIPTLQYSWNGGSAGAVLIGPAQSTLNTWQMWSVTNVNGSISSRYIYKNGVQVASGTTTVLLSTIVSPQVTVGISSTTANGLQYTFAGYIDDFQVKQSNYVTI